MTLVCYLDDSGTDAVNPLVAMAGYIGTVDAWQAYEKEARPILNAKGVSILHGKEFFSNDGEFKGWKVDERVAFVKAINAALRPRVGLAICFSTLKSSFVDGQRGRPKNQSPYGFCFTGLLDRLFKDEGFMKAVRLPGVNLSFVIEDGNRHNDEILQRYQRLKRDHGKELPFLAGMAFAAKDSSVAIQTADLFAFLTRRQAVAMEKNNREPIPHHQYLTALREGIRDIGFAATEFGYDD